MPQKTGVLACVSLLVVVISVIVQASLPGHRGIRYVIYDDPASPAGRIILTVTLQVSQAETRADAVGWRVERAVVRQIGERPELDRAWQDSAPNVGASDDLWWVWHADVRSPLTSEFDSPPLLQGVARATTGSHPDLRYWLRGDSYAGPALPHSGPMSALDYSFSLMNSQEVVDEAEDEPAEIEPEDTDPPEGED